MPAIEIRDLVLAREWGLADGYSTPKETLEWKLKEAKSYKLWDSIRKEGIREPVVVMPNDRPTIGNGHHRLACAIDLDLYVPLFWHTALFYAYGYH